MCRLVTRSMPGRWSGSGGGCDARLLHAENTISYMLCMLSLGKNETMLNLAQSGERAKYQFAFILATLFGCHDNVP